MKKSKNLYCYADESIHTDFDFTLTALIFSKTDFEKIISEILIKYGMDPNKEEFKSFLCGENSPYNDVREEFKRIINWAPDIKIGIIISPTIKREYLGEDILFGFKQIASRNFPKSFIEFHIDEGIFLNQTKYKKLEENIQKSLSAKIYPEQNSQKIKGIQIADFVANYLSQRFKFFQNKKINEKKRSLAVDVLGYTRYNLLSEEWTLDNYPDAKSTGLYISPRCSKELKKKSKNAFAEVYFGCMH